MTITNYSLKMPSIVYNGENALDNIRTIVEGNVKKVALFTQKGICSKGLLDKPMALLKEAGAESGDNKNIMK